MLGTVRARILAGRPAGHVLTTGIEHSAVRQSCDQLARLHGVEVDAELAERTLRGYSPQHLLVALAASEEAIHALQDNFEVTYLDAAATEKHFAALSALLMCACHGTDGEWPEIQRQCADQIAAYFEAAPNAAVRNLVAAVMAGSLAMQGGEQGKTGGTRIVRRATDVLYQVVAGNIGSHSEDPDTSAYGLLSSLLRPEAPYVAQEVALTTLIKVVNSSLAADLAWATVEKVWRLLLGSPHMVSLLSKNAHSLLKALPEQSSGQLIRATIEKAKEDFRAAGEGSASHPGQVLALIPGELLPAGVVSDVLDAAVRAAERAFAGPYSKAGFANAVAMLESAASLYRMEHRGDLDVPAAGGIVGAVLEGLIGVGGAAGALGAMLQIAGQRGVEGGAHKDTSLSCPVFVQDREPPLSDLFRGPTPARRDECRHSPTC